MARRRRGLPVDGVLLLDKPRGLSSNQALQRARHLLKARKAGHTGTLDPLATGLLPLCFGEATKFSAYLLDADKVYRTCLRLGETTDTADAEGRVLERRAVPEFDSTVVEAVLDRFRGEIDQVPPMHSALKHQGRPLYELARQGQTVERASRRVTIYTVRLLSWTPDSLELEVACSKGTYIRTLAEDIGEALGCGAHVTALRRLKAGPFEAVSGQSGMVTLEDLAARESQEAREALLCPPDALVAHLPALSVEDGVAQRLLLGQRASSATKDLPVDTPTRLYRDQDFLGLVTVTATGDIAPRRLIAALP